LKIAQTSTEIVSENVSSFQSAGENGFCLKVGKDLKGQGERNLG